MSKQTISIRRKIAWLFLAAMAGLLGACTETTDGGVRTAGQRNLVPGSLPPPPTAKPFDPGTYKVGKPYQIAGQWYYPKVDLAYEETGIASWYGPNFHGRKTANGETFDMALISAAHRTLPMPSVVRVTNLGNGRSLIVRINDRGPFARGRIIDLSRRAAELLGFTSQGTAMVHVRLLADESLQAALAAGASGKDMVSFGPPPPKAAPSVAVSIEALSPVDVEGVAVAAAPPPSAQPPRQPVLLPSPPTGVESAGAKSTPPPFGAMTAIVDARETPRPLPAASTKPAADEGPVPEERETINVQELPKREKVEKVRVDHAPNIFIQAGAFRQFVNANRLRARLASLGHPVNVSQVYVTNQPFFRVRMGPLGSVEDADRALDKLVALGYPEARIVVD
jgi:rare lipoprotein A